MSTKRLDKATRQALWEAKAKADQIRQKVIDRLRTGTLPWSLPMALEPSGPEHAESVQRGRIWVGPGTGEPCSACDDLIEPTAPLSTELFYPSSGIIRFHQACSRIWDTERRKPISQ